MGRAFGTEVLFTREGGSGPEADLQDVLGAPVVFLGISLPADGWHAPNEKVEIPLLLKGAEAAAYLWADLARTLPPVTQPELLPDLALSRAVVDRAAHHRIDEAWLAAAGPPGHPGASCCAARRSPSPASRRGSTSTPGRGAARDRYLPRHRPTAPLLRAARRRGRHRRRARTAAGLREVGAAARRPRRRPGRARGGAGELARDAPHCPRCGVATVRATPATPGAATADGSEHYPRTDPAVIMLVVDDDDRLLLGRQATGRRGRFSTLAGFVEPGESLEEAVRREVFEEVGVSVGAVTYLGSQPWPFPSSLMLGFTAQALTTDVHRHDGEIAEARWFSRDDLRADIAPGEVPVAVDLDRAPADRALVRQAAARAVRRAEPCLAGRTRLGRLRAAHLLAAAGAGAAVPGAQPGGQPACSSSSTRCSASGRWSAMNVVLAGINVWFIRKLMRERHDERGVRGARGRRLRRLPAARALGARRGHPRVLPGFAGTAPDAGRRRSWCSTATRRSASCSCATRATGSRRSSSTT